MPYHSQITKLQVRASNFTDTSNPLTRILDLQPAKTRLPVKEASSSNAVNQTVEFINWGRGSSRPPISHHHSDHDSHQIKD